MTFRRIHLFALFGLLLAGSCFGQATRTWVSGVGDDANPCSRTAPGKTFAGAISKTATGGEIDALDPGGFGALTITKSITIDGGPGVAGVLVAATNGFNVVGSGTAPIVVTLRNLDFDGVTQGLVGINVSGPVILHVENCQIYGFTGAGISFAASGTGSALFVSNCHIHDDRGVGIVLQPTAPAIAEIQNCAIDDCAAGVQAETNSVVVAINTNVTANNGSGFEADTGGVLTVENGNVSFNEVGINAAGKITLSNVSIFDNLTDNLYHTKTGIIDSFRDNAENDIGGATTGGLPSAYLPSH